jgi:hypothetical protein
VTLTWWDTGEHYPIWKRAPVCLICTLADIRPKPWPWSYADHLEYEGWRRFRCQWCGRPVRVARTIRWVTSPTCCEDCERLDRNRRNKERRRVTRRPLACEVCGREFIPTRADAKTCSNKCRQALHRRNA